MKDQITSISKDLNEPKWLLKERLDSSNLSNLDFESVSPKDVEVKKSKNVKIYSFSEMLSKDEKFTKKIFLSRTKKSNTYNSYLNGFFRQCNFLFVDKGKHAELDLCFDNSLAINFVFIGAHASLRLLGSAVSNAMNLVDITLDENARLDAGLLKHKGAFSYCEKNTNLGTNSTANFMSFLSGSGVCNTSSFLKGVNSSVLHVDLSIAGDSESVNMGSEVFHLSNATKSNVVMRGVAQDTSKTILNGKVNVETNGKGSTSSLSQHVLLLDKGAKAETNPLLEIKNNAVECSHSAAIRSLEPEKLFYLQSRGLSEQLAKTTMITGFLRSAMNMMKDKELRNMFKPPFMQEYY